MGLDQDFVTIQQDQDISPYAEHSTGTTITNTNNGAKTASYLPRLFSPLSPVVTWGLVTYPRIAGPTPVSASGERAFLPSSQVGAVLLGRGHTWRTTALIRSESVSLSWVEVRLYFPASPALGVAS